MGLLDDLRDGIGTINDETAELQTNVSHEVYLTSDRAGKKSYDSPRARPAIVTKKAKLVRAMSGEMVTSQTQIVFLDPGVTVTPNDRLTLPDRTTGPILNIEGFMDPGTGKVMMTEVNLGAMTSASSTR